jgi:tetratricopeptide (TPR) repeat protein
VFLLYYEKSKDINSSLNLLANAAKYENIVGPVQHIQSNYNEAIKHYSASFKIREQLNDDKEKAYCYNNMGVAFYDQGNYKKALDNYFNPKNSGLDYKKNCNHYLSAYWLSFIKNLCTQN